MKIGEAIGVAVGAAKERHTDLMRQGFMKGPKSRAPKKERPIVTCHQCENWHREGMHTATPEVRRANRQKYRAKK